MSKENAKIQFIAESPGGSVDFTGSQSSVGRPIAIVDLNFLIKVAQRAFRPADFKSFKESVLYRLGKAPGHEEFRTAMWDELVELDTLDQIMRHDLEVEPVVEEQTM